MKALSFWQPYAWFIVNGHADVDSRLWAPPEKYIGTRIAIHASLRKITRDEFAEFLETVKSLGIRNHPKSREEFDYGKVVGTVVIRAVTKKSKSYFAIAGYYHWQLSAAEQTTPVAAKGHRGWFTWP